ncbi:hypothetical protein [Nostoc favosum]|uniref:Uncharacterized protein n=1 Tax=Nostoc favosum CHAB5714 TaxID=2780399 RepID=A0ABS8IKG7_9NOSO|nr:hypothetical protein [Nostoc favosum]MCC5604742.1 hypothetical protein [Nostoc favosum CHAB5714]
MLKLEVASVTVSDRLKGVPDYNAIAWLEILNCYEHRRRATARQIS